MTSHVTHTDSAARSRAIVNETNRLAACIGPLRSKPARLSIFWQTFAVVFGIAAFLTVWGIV